MAGTMIRLYLFVTVLGLSLSSGLCNIFNSMEERNVDNFVKTTMTCREIPGLTLTVVKGNMTWTRGFGMADLDNDIRVTPKTLFYIGSLGKAFTMTLLGILIENTRYTWTTRVADIEEIELDFIDDEITENITLADMLSHSTGLSAVMDYGFIGGYPPMADRPFFSKRTKYIPKVNEFRKSFVYNNMMYAMLGYIAELLGKDTWQNLVTSHLLEPLGMTSSRPMDADHDVVAPGVAKPYIKPGLELEDGNHNIYKISPIEPAGGILSNGEDMAKWMRFNLKLGLTEDNVQLIDRNLLDEAFKDHNMLPFGGAMQSTSKPVFPIDDLTKSYGYAWFTSNYRGHRKIWHSGGLFSYISLLYLYPDDQAGVFVSLNGPGIPKNAAYGLKTIMFHVSDLLLGQSTWLNETTTCSFSKPWNKFSMEDLNFDQKPKGNFTNNNLELFVGTYGNMILPDVEISIRQRETENSPYLWLELNRIKGELLLTANETEFNFKMVEPWEYAIERVLAKNIITTYPVRFIKVDMEYDLEVEFSPKEIIRFSRDIRLININSAPSNSYIPGLAASMIMVLAIKVVL